ncbi:transposase domain-containing protein [Microvirga terricola]|uniref:Mu DNA-binding domain-containing protein n=1 Tax=Microvirga terricola TaxID=2719797 RepID=A0ABX0V876_9HYPH|nr:transposase domain-containing protein [Microvirga terricola]NIX75416.1 hypothetical protein [Microvirga terricola]
MSMRFYTPAELASMSLPGLPGTERGVQLLADRENWRQDKLAWPANLNGLWRRREGRGGGFEYAAGILPLRAQTALSLKEKRERGEDERKVVKSDLAREDVWRSFESMPEKKKAEARRRLEALDAVNDMERAGTKRDVAMMLIANSINVSLRTLYGWSALVAGRPRADWLPYLAPRHAGRQAEVECSAEAWDVIKADYLRPERPAFADCYRRLKTIAAEKGWTIPAERTLQRRMDAMPRAVIVLAREGQEALKRLYPAQQRDRSGFHALEAVNADGHKFDVFVKWPDGTIGRPVLTAFQDLYSGLMLAWRIERTECKEAVLLAFGDLVETYGIPDACWLDNGRNFASKWLTGGTANRYRFKVRDDEPAGVMTTLGVEVHWTTPYSGQSKPIERAFRDFSQSIAKDPRLAGAWTGNTVANKPSNYGSNAIPIELFEKVIAEGIAEHNARPGRRSQVCNGRSFMDAFQANYAQSPIRKATAEQRRLWLLAAEGVSVRSQDATIHLLGNRFWCEALVNIAGGKVVARFDPDALHDGIHVYRLDGSYVAHAPCIEAAGFASTADARIHAQARKAWMKGQAQILAAETKLGIDGVAALLPTLPEQDPAPLPVPNVVRPLFGNLAVKATPVEDISPDETLAAFSRSVLRLVQSQEAD